MWRQYVASDYLASPSDDARYGPRTRLRLVALYAMTAASLVSQSRPTFVALI